MVYLQNREGNWLPNSSGLGHSISHKQPTSTRILAQYHRSPFPWIKGKKDCESSAIATCKLNKIDFGYERYTLLNQNDLTHEIGLYHKFVKTTLTLKFIRASKSLTLNMDLHLYDIKRSKITYKSHADHLVYSYLHSVTIRSIALSCSFFFLSRSVGSASTTTLGNTYFRITERIK